MIEWNYIVTGVSLLLIFFLLWKEVSRKNKARLALRILTTLFAVISLACMALPITCYTTKNTSFKNEAVLLTEGFNRDSVNRFLSVSNRLSVFTTGNNIKDAVKYNTSFISDINLLLQQHKDINTLHVFGYGIKKDELDKLKDVQLIFHPSEIPAGIINIHWQREMKTGDQLYVQGTFNNSINSKAKIVLSYFNTTLDSVNIAAGKNEPFELITTPKNADRTVYTLAVIADNDTIEKEFLPVTVKKGEPLKVLVLASSPDFENKFLQNYLSQNGYVVAARTAISKNKFVKNFLNTPALPLDHITSSLLDKFDITIADASELAAISKSELATLQTQVAQKSMGLIIKTDSAANSAFYTSKFPLTTLAGNNQQKLNLYLVDSFNKMPPVSTENIVSIHNLPGTQPLVFDRENHLFVNSTLYGSGKILLTTLSNTYNWSLAGEQKGYETFWSTLLNKVAPKHAADETWSISPALPEINTPTQLQVETNKSTVPQGQVNGASVYLKQHADLPYEWSGKYYAAKAGWQSAIQLNGQIFYWYAYNKEDWKNIKAAQTTEATKRYVFENYNIKNKAEKEVQQTKSEVPKIIFFVLFVLFAGFLWLENKM